MQGDPAVATQPVGFERTAAPHVDSLHPFQVRVFHLQTSAGSHVEITRAILGSSRFSTLHYCVSQADLRTVVGAHIHTIP